jgi:Glutathione S-transferase, C-terminal domain
MPLHTDCQCLSGFAFHTTVLVRIDFCSEAPWTMKADMEIELSKGPWLAGLQFSLADIGYAPYILRLDHLQLQFLWDKRQHVAAWYDRVQAQHGYKEGIDDRIDASYYLS